ncbi:hypothetical protein ABIB06_007599 [Bradyrhizobium sp. LB8.2]
MLWKKSVNDPVRANLGARWDRKLQQRTKSASLYMRGLRMSPLSCNGH